MKSKEKLLWKEIGTPIGKMLAGADRKGICFLQFADHTEMKADFSAILSDEQEGRSFLTLLEKELEEYFGGKRREFSVPLSVHGSDFQKKVWEKLGEIPYGTTKTYREQAEHIGNPNSVRAVASANARNVVNILIPCHRVISSNGRLAGYNGGILRKQQLLDLEKKYKKSCF